MRNTITRYAAAVAISVAAIAIELALPSIFGGIPFFLFFVAVFVTALFCGTGPSIVSVALAGYGTLRYFRHEASPLALDDPQADTRIVLFVITALSVSWIVAGYRRREQMTARLALARLNELKNVDDERLRLSAEIERERERLMSVVSNVPGVVWEAWGEPDAGTQRIDFVSDHVTRMLGYSVEEWVSTPNFWLTIVHPDDREAAANTARTHYEAGGTLTNRFRWITKDGRALWCESQSTVVTDEAGRPIGMRGVVTDISARRRAESSLTFLAEVSEILVSSLEYERMAPAAAQLAARTIGDWCAITHFDLNGRPRRLAMEHVDPGKAEAARRLLSFQPRETPADIVTNLELRKPTILHQVSDEFIERQGPEQAALLRELGMASMLVVPLGPRDRLIGAVSFISAQPGRYDKLDIELAELFARRLAIAIDNADLYRAAIESSNAKDEFLATISHELRTPMTATLGWVHLLKLAGLDEETRRTALDSIERSTHAQSKLIEDILDVSSIVLGKFRLEIARVDLQVIVDEAIRTIWPGAEARSIQIDFRGGDAPVEVMGDPDRLQQVVWNLLSNSLKFGHAGGHVTIRLERADSVARIVVSDDGEGIDPFVLPHVFDRFRQGETGTTRKHGGMGLGLSIVQHLVELHGGTVHAASEGRDRGATFTVEVPAASEP